LALTCARFFIYIQFSSFLLRASYKALKEVNEAMERELGQYKEQNERLHKTVGELEGSVKNLQELEQTLKEIKMMESSTLDELEVQLQEQKEIEDQLEDNLVAEICQNVISICLAVDKDGDMNLSDDEIALLIAKIQVGFNSFSASREMNKDNFSHACKIPCIVIFSLLVALQ